MQIQQSCQSRCVFFLTTTHQITMASNKRAAKKAVKVAKAAKAAKSKAAKAELVDRIKWSPWSPFVAEITAPEEPQAIVPSVPKPKPQRKHTDPKTPRYDQGLTVGWWVVYAGNPDPVPYHSLRAMVVDFQRKGIPITKQESIRAYIRRVVAGAKPKCKTFERFSKIVSIRREGRDTDYLESRPPPAESVEDGSADDVAEAAWASMVEEPIPGFSTKLLTPADEQESESESESSEEDDDDDDDE